MKCEHCGEEMLYLEDDLCVCVNEECIEFFKSNYAE